ncbi:hypothetical protein XELAEV_18023000mg [Xenopus laevis]|uniref:Uncharacterized protein n=1 Tax=Xenopus laevis TaxID=8355 RepID=A0A974HNP0_XENLA|nr:hypothetical protein XELAEV_18023000mg [Xenopus laevis]
MGRKWELSCLYSLPGSPDPFASSQRRFFPLQNNNMRVARDRSNPEISLHRRYTTCCAISSHTHMICTYTWI